MKKSGQKNQKSNKNSKNSKRKKKHTIISVFEKSDYKRKL